MRSAPRSAVSLLVEVTVIVSDRRSRSASDSTFEGFGSPRAASSSSTCTGTGPVVASSALCWRFRLAPDWVLVSTSRVWVATNSSGSLVPGAVRKPPMAPARNPTRR